MEIKININHGDRACEINYRRIISLMIIFCVLYVVVALRLFDRSVLQNGLAEAKSLAQQEVSIKLNPFRGKILLHGAEDGKFSPVAMNEPRAKIEIVPRNVKDKAGLAKKLAPILKMPENDLYSAINNDKSYIPPISRNQAMSVGNQIEDLKLSGVSVSTESLRTYPEGKLASQVIGFVNADGNGQYGIEGYYDNLLQGYASSVTGQRDGWGNITIDKNSAANNKGSDIVLTIDRDVQATVEQMLQASVSKFKAKSGSVVIVEPATGKVIAMANVPTYDPNAYFQISTSGQSVFNNPIISRSFEPGSVMKSISIVSGLDSGKVLISDQGNYGSSVKVDNYEIHTATNEAYGHESIADVLVNSDNVAMVDISNKIGRELLDDYLTRFGFGQKSGIDLDTEITGLVPALKDWRPINTATISFGQGISSTSLQMVMAYAAIANKGVMMKPVMVDKVILPDGKAQLIEPKQIRQVVSQTSSAQITDMLTQVVVRGHGKLAGVPGYSVAGKTGTAQIPKPDGRGYLETAFNGSFAGFAPVDNPKFAMFVTLEEPQGVSFAESSAAPLWGQIAAYLLKNHYHVAPSN